MKQPGYLVQAHPYPEPAQILFQMVVALIALSNVSVDFVILFYLPLKILKIFIIVKGNNLVRPDFFCITGQHFFLSWP